VAFLALPIAANAQYTTEDLAMALAYGSCNKLFLEGTAAHLNAFGHAPSADTLVAMLDKVPAAALLESFRQVNSGLIVRAKEEGLLNGEAILALDMHRVARYRRPRDKYKGKRRARDLPMAVGGKSVAGTSLAHQFATIEVMGSQPRLALEVVPWFHGSTYRETIAKLLDSAKRHVKAEMLLMDREFFNEESVGAAMDAHVHFLVPAKKNAKVRSAMARCRGLKYWMEPYDLGERRMNLIVVDRETIGWGRGDGPSSQTCPGRSGVSSRNYIREDGESNLATGTRRRSVGGRARFRTTSGSRCSSSRSWRRECGRWIARMPRYRGWMRCRRIS